MPPRPMERSIRFVLIATAVIGLLALASYLTTASDWDGGFPAGEFRLNIRNADGQPVKSATLRVYHGGTQDDAFKYPLNNYLPGQMLIRDANAGHVWRRTPRCLVRLLAIAPLPIFGACRKSSSRSR